MKQIYLDNGATSFPKAPGVRQAMKDYIEKVGVNVNRSSYRATAEAALSTLTVRAMTRAMPFLPAGSH